jgi:hypothetical protein
MMIILRWYVTHASRRYQKKKANNKSSISRMRLGRRKKSLRKSSSLTMLAMIKGL